MTWGEFGCELRFGVITAVQRRPLRYKVRLPDADGMETPWLLALTAQSFGANNTWAMAVGTQVALLLSQQAESGVVLGAVHSEADPESDGEGWTQDFGDGSSLHYAPDSQTLTLKAVQAVRLDTPLTQVQRLEASEDVRIAGKPLLGHTHGEHDHGGQTEPF